MLMFQSLPPLLASGYTNVLGLEDSFTFMPPTDCLRLPQLPATSYDYLLPPMTTYCLPRLLTAYP